ncbi:rhomboid-like protein [Nocardia sp. NBC_01388]|uniref:rhomboid-like protein n=1 Tax=Nocardia sp. NBC_01388 TaxID=2903596 RepID=UPI003245D99C
MVEIFMAGRASAGFTPVISVLRRRRWLPVTVGYVFLLVVITMVLAADNESDAERVIAQSSTNLHNLLNGHVGTLFSSAFVIGDTDSALTSVPLFACLLALVELRLGALHTVRIFLTGHIGATLVVAVGLWVTVAQHWLPASVDFAEDVGISYGAMALFGSLVALVPEKFQVVWATVWLAIAVEGVVGGETFTNVGHLVSYCIGLAIGVVMINRGVSMRHRPTALDLVLLSCAGLLAGTFMSA